MNTKELAAAVAARTGLNLSAAHDSVAAVLDLIAAEVADGEPVNLAGFGVFEARRRSARTGRDPRSGEPIAIAERRTPGFRAAAAFRQRVNAG
ncbi:MAG: HU family DNA-binding protein [Micropruina sp.]|uniref:HU family DNA-binding protein n=1 Tax=Micropruina sp. TaxID=2737536 RepID=UPI0039E4796C